MKIDKKVLDADFQTALAELKAAELKLKYISGLLNYLEAPEPQTQPPEENARKHTN